MNVVALHRPAKVSGVSTAGLHAALMHPDPWRPLIVGPNLTSHDLQTSVLSGAPGTTLCTWPSTADPIDQVLHVRDALRALNADVVVPNDLPHAFIAAALDHHRNRRCAAWLHSASHDGEQLVTHCFELADAWRAVSHVGRRRALSTAYDLNLTIPPPRATAPAFIDVPAEPTPPPIDNSTLRLLYSGRLEKHHKRILDLAALCDALTIPFHLTIAGDGPAEAELRARLAPHAAYVTLTGPVSPAHMRTLIDAHHVLILVSASEAAPMCIMEAMAHARPVAITSTCGEAVHWIHDHVQGLIVPTGDMRALAARLSSLSPRALAHMGRKAHARALELFSSAARAPALHALATEACLTPAQLTPADLHTRWTRILHALHALGPVSSNRVQHLAHLWLTDLRSCGIDTSTLNLPLSTPNRQSPAERLLLRTVASLKQQGLRRFALYGAGLHTRNAAATIEQSPELIAIIDDAAGQPQGPPPTLAGKPVLPPAAFAQLNADAIIISSDEHEREMTTKARVFATRVIPLYENNTAAA